MTKQTSILPLLESVVRDNITYKFPIEFINKELTEMFLEPLEFDYFMVMIYRKLKREFGEAIAHIFLQVIELKMKIKERDIYSLSTTQFQDEMEDFLTSLENTYITKIDKSSPDGEMMTAMI